MVVRCFLAFLVNDNQTEPVGKRKRLARWCLLLLASAGSLLLIAVAPWGTEDLCGNDNLVEALSPDGRHKAVAFRRSCGATTPFSTHVSILTSSRQLSNEAGNVFVHDELPALSVRWLDDSHLHISGANPRTAFRRLEDFEGIHIRYD